MEGLKVFLKMFLSPGCVVMKDAASRSSELIQRSTDPVLVLAALGPERGCLPHFFFSSGGDLGCGVNTRKGTILFTARQHTLTIRAAFTREKP